MNKYALPLLAVFLMMNYVNPRAGFINPTTSYRGADADSYLWLDYYYRYKENRASYTRPYHTKAPNYRVSSTDCYQTQKTERTARKGLVAKIAVVCKPRYQVIYPTDSVFHYSNPRQLRYSSRRY